MKYCEKTVCEDCEYFKNKLFSEQCNSCYRNMNFKRKESLVSLLEEDYGKNGILADDDSGAVELWGKKQ